MNTNTTTTTTTNKDLSLQREHDVWELRKRCWSQEQIAQHLGLSQSAVSQILKRIRNRLAEQFDGEAGKLLLEQVSQLMHIAQEALNAWEQTKTPSPPIPNAPTPVAPPPDASPSHQEQQQSQADQQTKPT